MKANTNALDNMVTRVMSRTDVFVSRESCRAWIERYYEREGCTPTSHGRTASCTRRFMCIAIGMISRWCQYDYPSYYISRGRCFGGVMVDAWEVNLVTNFDNWLAEKTKDKGFAEMMERDTDTRIAKDAFEVMSVTYDAEIELDYDTNLVTIRAVDENGNSVAEVSFHRYKDTPMLAVHKMKISDLPFNLSREDAT